MTVTVEYHQLRGLFPRELRPDTLRLDARFDTPHERTVKQLRTEVAEIGGETLFIKADLDLSGAGESHEDPPPPGAPSLSHPGVAVYCDSQWGWLTFCCDDAHQWQANLRSIMLAMEALREAARHGSVILDGEQYRGFLMDDGGET